MVASPKIFPTNFVLVPEIEENVPVKASKPTFVEDKSKKNSKKASENGGKLQEILLFKKIKGTDLLNQKTNFKTKNCF